MYKWLSMTASYLKVINWHVLHKQEPEDRTGIFSLRYGQAVLRWGDPEEVKREDRRTVSSRIRISHPSTSFLIQVTKNQNIDISVPRVESNNCIVVVTFSAITFKRTSLPTQPKRTISLMSSSVRFLKSTSRVRLVTPRWWSLVQRCRRLVVSTVVMRTCISFGMRVRMRSLRLIRIVNSAVAASKSRLSSVIQPLCRLPDEDYRSCRWKSHLLHACQLITVKSYESITSNRSSRVRCYGWLGNYLKELTGVAVGEGGEGLVSILWVCKKESDHLGALFLREYSMSRSLFFLCLDRTMASYSSEL